MNASSQPAFYYHADASALGGILHQPVQKIVSTDASLSLPQAGGFSTRRMERFNLQDLVTMEGAHVRVSGTEHKEERGWRTIATATIEKLNILEIITADRIVAQATVMHPYDGGHAELSFNGAQFVNFKINGNEVNPELQPEHVSGRWNEDRGNGQVLQVHAGSKLRFTDLIKVAEKQYEQGASWRKELVERLGSRFAFVDPLRDLDQKGSTVCSLVQEIKSSAPVEQYGHMLHMPDFGNLFFGEVVVSRNSAQLTMLRVEMGCIAKGSLSVCSAFSNGRTMP